MVGLKLNRQIHLEGTHVQLEPLQEIHAVALAEIGLDQEIWRHMPYGAMRTPEDILTWVRGVLKMAERGMDIPFVVIHKASGRIVGATRFMELRPEHRGVEIGGTWYGARFRRTFVNTECKYLLLTHAFEFMGCIRVQFKTDSRNERSQKAIERIGGVREGVLRNHMILPDGMFRHSVYYSILVSEWPEAKVRLQRLLNR